MSAFDDPRYFTGTRFTLTIRGVRAGVVYIIRSPDGRRVRDIWAVDVIGHDSLMPPKSYAVDEARGGIQFETDHPIVTVRARCDRKAQGTAGRRTS